MRPSRSIITATGIALGIIGSGTAAFAQTTSPPSIAIGPDSAVCRASGDFPVSITLPGGAVIDRVDVLLLFDDTGSFAGFVPTVASIFSSLVTSLEAAVPGVDFGFGVARFEDYGGPGTGFSSETSTGRPFTLNQPIITAADAGGAVARDALIAAALSRTAPGFGGDGPESGLEALFQVGTGLGFDGDGNGSSLDSGPAGAVNTQTVAGTSGDVPPFSSNVAPASGALGGAGFRPGALHLVLLATDICSISAFPSGAAIPATIAGAGGSSEPVTAFACATTTPGSSRFGFVSDAKTLASNTVAGAVAPSDSSTVQGTVTALNALGIRVIGMGPAAAPTSAVTPSFGPSVWLSAIARLTGAVDGVGNPLVFSTSVPLSDLTTSIADAITTTTTLPVDITLQPSTLPAGLTVSVDPPIVTDVAPTETAPFTVTMSGSSSTTGSFALGFFDIGSGAELGTIPVSVSCEVTKVFVPLDIKPTSCPNPFNMKDQGIVPAAILGSSTLDVTHIDLSSIALAGVPPLRSELADVATPFTPISGKTTSSDCNTLGPDGFLDLTLKFDAPALAAALGGVADGDLVILRLTGNLLAEFGGAEIEGEDVMIILKKGK